MKPTQISAALETAIQANRPVFLWGSPGIGKSQVVAQLAAKTDKKLIDLRLVHLDPVDLRGLPVLSGQGDSRSVVWVPPSFLPRSGKGILFLDEMNLAPQAVQAAGYQLVLDRRLGEYVLPEGWAIVAAGNREGDRTGVQRMPTALRNRFIHLNFEVDLNDWVAWAIDHDIMTEIIAFLRFRPELLNNFDPSKDDKAFPTPRAWQFVSDILKQKPDSSLEYELISGAVGEGAAAEFTGFMRIYRTLPDPDLIIMNPKGAEVPTDPATLYALCGALAKRAGDNSFPNIVEYSFRIPAEFSVLLITDIVKANKGLMKTRAFIAWTAKHSSVII